MAPLDTALAIIGAFAAAVERGLGSPRRARCAVAGLLTVSAIPILFVGSSPRPTDLTFEDVGLDRIPALTSWVRLEGEVHDAGSASVFELHDSADDARYVIVISNVPLTPGHAIVTGRISPLVATTGNVGTIEADDVAVPRVDEPIWLYLTPGVIAIILAIGLRLGYPVVRRERIADASAERLGPSETIRAWWSGRIRGEEIPGAAPLACRLGVASAADAPDLVELSLVGETTTRTVRIRHHAPVQPVRSCRVRGNASGLEIHSNVADAVLTFSDRAARDRVVATLR